MSGFGALQLEGCFGQRSLAPTAPGLVVQQRSPRGLPIPGAQLLADRTDDPAVSSVVIGPRTMQQLNGYLAAENTDLSEDVLDNVDAIVCPTSRST